MTTVFGLAALIARTARQTGPSGSADEVPTASFSSGIPNRITERTPSEASDFASTAASSADTRSTPGMDNTGWRTPAPGTTKSGAMKSEGASDVSRTIVRRLSERRSRR